MSESDRQRLDRILHDDEAITSALREGVQEALLRHKRLGQCVIVWRDGRVVRLPPDQIPLPPDAA